MEFLSVREKEKMSVGQKKIAILLFGHIHRHTIHVVEHVLNTLLKPSNVTAAI
jgi:hypothetical protein